MATLTEASVIAVLTAERSEDGTVRVYAHGVSKDTDGNTVRRLQGRLDITDTLSGAQKTGATNVLASAETQLKALWNIT